VRFRALNSAQDGHAAIPGYRLVIGKRPSYQKLQVFVGLGCYSDPVPCSSDHRSFSHTTVVLTGTNKLLR